MEEDTVDMIDSASDGISATSGKNRIVSIIRDIIFKIRYMKQDVQTVERAAELMEEVGLLDKTLRVSNGEMICVCLSVEELKEQRRRMEGVVRLSMRYDGVKYGSSAEFDKLVPEETDKRLQACNIKGLSIVATTVSTLKRHDPLNPGNVPVEGEMFESDGQEAGTSSAHSTSTDRATLTFRVNCCGLHTNPFLSSPHTLSKIVQNHR